MANAVNKDTQPVIHAMAELARTSPQAWSAFVTEFKTFTDRGKDQLVHAIMSLEVVQGSVQERSRMLWLLENCKEESDKLRRKTGL